ncbi:type III pantothenate kinase [Mucilaginibacter daejeonensis]|uniref:type III pantothenate kinase n=1 Tax=Mucilaginibacter daejeonensis TaxID=398049 RepID=UPI001D16FFE4|nr:type III pantothenate kinase [Mucilaginibacter daejeonensis]UEG52956.1 type III pantothenate kinase [Mucilaginibacter daejeonensis]
MARLAIDIGNTRVKTGIFQGHELLRADSHDQMNLADLLAMIDEYAVTQAIVSTVKKEAQPWLDQLAGSIPVIGFNRDMAGGIHNHYRTPRTLGLDRLAAVLGAKQSYPGTDRLVIDAGTCITYDGIDAGSNYFGGSISPGLNMRYKALAHYTSVLPEVDADLNFSNYYGDDTTTAIRSGVQNGITYEVLGFIQQYKRDHTQLNIILTGGDSVFLDTVLKNSIFAGYIKTEPHLVLKGLNAAIQEHNDQL